LFTSAVHSFILDVDDKLIAEHFTEAELREIEDTPIPEVSELSDEIVNLLNKFIGKVINIPFTCCQHTAISHQVFSLLL
jgi:hypothetical protein